MWSATSVLVCVLSVLGRSADTLPPIELVDAPPVAVSRNAEGYVWPGSGTISLVTSSAVFRDAQSARSQCGKVLALRKLASVIVHEEWHVLHGTDERGAYEAQLMTLARLGSGPGSPLYSGVWLSMQAVLEARERQQNEPPRPLELAARGH